MRIDPLYMKQSALSLKIFPLLLLENEQDSHYAQVISLPVSGAMGRHFTSADTIQLKSVQYTKLGKHAKILIRT